MIRAAAGAVSFAIWSTTEAAVALLCACLPLLRPVVTKFYTVLSTYGTNTIQTFGLEQSQSTPSRGVQSSIHATGNHDSVHVRPLQPYRSSEKETRYSAQAYSLDESEVKEEV